jgi:hypothetical protein
MWAGTDRQHVADKAHLEKLAVAQLLNRLSDETEREIYYRVHENQILYPNLKPHESNSHPHTLVLQNSF